MKNNTGNAYSGSWKPDHMSRRDRFHLVVGIITIAAAIALYLWL